VKPEFLDASNPIERENGRDRLVDAAIALFSRRGYEGVSITEIGKLAGVTPQLIYHYFRSGKRGLYREAYLKSLNHLMALSIRNLPPDPDPENPGAKLIAVEGVATFIRNVVTAAGNPLDPRENEILLLSYRDAFELPPDFAGEFMEKIWLSVRRIRTFLSILAPGMTPRSMSLLATAVTGPLYHERMITGIQTSLRNGDVIPAETKAEFFIAYTLRALGADKDLPASHPYCASKVDRILFSLA
jgi:AcrR family transcriptional regulator